MKESRIILFILLAALVVYGIFYLATRNLEMPKNQSMPWQSYVNDEQNTVVFDLVIGQSTLSDAMRLFGTEVEASLFENDEHNPTLEAYFSSTKVGGLSAKVILNLAIDIQRLDYLNHHIDETEKLPTGNQKTTYKPSVESQMLDLVITSLTFIPSADLEKTTIQRLFGQPDKIQIHDETIEYWHYSKKGLRIITDQAGKEILEFYNKAL